MKQMNWRRSLGLICGLAWLPAVLAADPAPAAPLPVTAAPATSTDEVRDIRAQLAPRQFTTLASEIGAKISSLPVPEGSAFKKGQVLVGFDCSLQQAQLNKARAGLSAADKTWSANKRLNELNSIGQVELQVSEAEVMKNRAEVSLMSTMLGKCSITAPFAGRVVEQKMREQQFAQPGQAILDILDDSVLEIEFLAPSRWLSWLKNGTLLQLRVDETGKQYPAKITRIGARVDPVSQSIKLVATIDGHYAELIAGMSGTVVLSQPVSH
ncbi:HlyD family secretion protein [Pseudomonas sp. StFLB209]|uniref:efflux RND transporter periplasmic adaptor subunit n=1 Tax=Pseudomonas sp. StFLB209 TaxID=1028989 RepID=UPI0004F65C7A|nr:efflux RND transporter periplasmic adaptor subunit [Pseudomonas sp. StFLB209]BAP40740.1 HlyD family secretion protein [Pseudomonas sp. StFLB209]